MLLKKNIPIRYVFGKIAKELVLVSIYATAIALLAHNQHITPRLSIPLSVPMIMGTVISLLLGFRSNQAYDRWWEARTVWGAIVNDSRTLARQVLTFVDPGYVVPEVQEFRRRFIHRQIAWCYSLGQSLRDEDGLRNLERLIAKKEIQALEAYTNKPSAILELHARDLNHAMEQGWINQFQQVELDRTLTRLCDSMGKCERIKNTVFPATYSLYIHFAMNFFILLLPFALIDFFGMMMVPMVVAIAASFMLIEKMAIHLQDPFENKPTDTPMTAISRNIERDMKQMLKEHSIGEDNPAPVYKYYVL